MTFAWQEHGGDRAGVRIPFTPPIADPVPFSIEVVLPIADSADTDFGDVVLTGRLPLFYWKTDITDVQPLQRGANDFILPAGATLLEVGVYRNTQNQILNNEYIYNEESSAYPILKTVIFKMRVPEGNINLPRFGERDYEIDVTRLNTRRPLVITSIEQINSLQNAEICRKEIIVRFNQPVVYPMFFTIADAGNEPIGAGSPGRLDAVGYPSEYLKRGVLNDPNDQVSVPYVLAPAYQNGFLLRSSTIGSDTWFSAVSEPYPIKGSQFGNQSFLIPIGASALKYQYTYNRQAMNNALTAVGKATAWERVFLHLTKQWLSGTESGRHYRDSRVEMVEITYPST